jgi:hypothetical protein
LVDAPLESVVVEQKHMILDKLKRVTSSSKKRNKMGVTVRAGT